jgi:hypothetical protein
MHLNFAQCSPEFDVRKMYTNFGQRLGHLGGEVRSGEWLTAVGDYAAVSSQLRIPSRTPSQENVGPDKRRCNHSSDFHWRPDNCRRRRIVDDNTVFAPKIPDYFSLTVKDLLIQIRSRSGQD